MEVHNINVEKDKSNVYKVLSLFLLIMCVFFAVKVIHGLKGTDGGPRGAGEMNIISVTGHGEVQAVPDIAKFYFTITKEAKTVKEAQDMVAVVEKSSIDALKELGVLEKDIQANNTNFYPKYEYQSPGGARLACNQWGCPPSAGKQVVIGYEASESITVKVRDTDKSGDIQQALGTLGVTNLNGPDFSIDDEEALKVSARREAINNAKDKAKMLAKDLGVRLGRISSFSETGNYYPMYAKLEMASAQDASAGNTAPAILPKGENTISSDVTINYEIR